MSKSITQRYLEKYAEPETFRDAERFLHQVDNVMVIPVKRESTLNPLLDSILKATQEAFETTLVIVVVNAPIDDLESRHVNRVLLRELARADFDGPEVLVIDRSTHHPLPIRQGVGLARKVGADVAVCLWNDGKIRKPWIHNTDADARIGSDYLTRLPGFPETYAFCHPYEHDTSKNRALALYELGLRYYFEGLRYAKSPYTYSAIGSCISVHAQAYAEVRGFPKREAAEDFYFLNKVSKLGRVQTGGGLVYLEDRPSNRVPFGTGQSVRLIQQLPSIDSYRLYAPKSFELLRILLESAEAYITGKTKRIEDSMIAQPERSYFCAALKNLRVVEVTDEAIERRRSTAQRLRHFHERFDALKTLKFIHYLRNNYLGTENWRTALTAPFIKSQWGVLSSNPVEAALQIRASNAQNHINASRDGIVDAGRLRS